MSRPDLIDNVGCEQGTEKAKDLTNWTYKRSIFQAEQTAQTEILQHVHISCHLELAGSTLESVQNE